MVDEVNPAHTARLRAFLESVERGEITLVSHGAKEPQQVYAGNCWYTASDGTKLVVFNDCNEWDYIDHIEFPDGLRLGFEAISIEYTPSEEVSWRCYGIPGYLKFREPWPGYKGEAQ